MVLHYIKNLGKNEDLDIPTLTKKLATLLALLTAHRVQTLAAIRIDNIKESTEGIVIRIPDRIKTSGKNRLQPTLELPRYQHEQNLCAVATIKEYVKRTKAVRQPGQDRLFITYKKPFHGATSQSLSRWIKIFLQKSGVDTSTFSAHSTRHAATSAAHRKGINIELIRKTAGWSKDSEIFAKFYNRPLSNAFKFANCILDCE